MNDWNVQKRSSQRSREHRNKQWRSFCSVMIVKICQNMPIFIWHFTQKCHSQFSSEYAKNMPIFGNMPTAKILQPSTLKYAKFVFSGKKYANLATLHQTHVSAPNVYRKLSQSQGHRQLTLFRCHFARDGAEELKWFQLFGLQIAWHPKRGESREIR